MTTLGVTAVGGRPVEARTRPGGGFEALLPRPGVRAGMEIDRKLVAELGVSVTAVVVFIGVAVLVSQAYAAPATLTGNFSGEVTGEVTNDTTGEFTGEISGDVSDDLVGEVSGEVSGTAPDASGEFTRQVNGSVSGEVPDEGQSFAGNVSGQFADGGNFSGEVTGDVAGNATTSPVIAPAGGLAMIGVIVLFIVLMAGAGLVMYRLDFDEE